MRRLERRLTLETMLMAGSLLFIVGVTILAAVTYSWFGRGLTRGATVLPAVIGTSMMTLGAQTVLGGFFLSIIAGNEARFMRSTVTKAAPPLPWRREAAKRAEKLHQLAE